MSRDGPDMDGVVILGAGLAGLGCGIELPGSVLFEASSHPGGHAYSHELAGYHFDEGAHISHTRDEEFLALIKKHAGGVHSFNPSIVRNYRRGAWTGYPIQNALADLPRRERALALSDLVVAHVGAADGTPGDYEEWCRRQYGDYLTDNYYDEFTRKYWRRRPAELSTDWLGGRLIPSDLPNVIRGALGEPVEGQASFTRFHYPSSGGFFDFFNAMYEGVDVRSQHEAVEIDAARGEVRFSNGKVQAYDDLASSIPLPALVRMIPSAPASVREAAERLHHTKLLCVNVVVSVPDLTDLHWCYVYDEDIPPARISFPSNLSPHPHVSSTAIQAEVFRDHREAWTPQALFEETLMCLGRMLGFDAEEDVVDAALVVVPHAYVVSDHDRAPAVDHILEWLDEVQIQSVGLYGRWRYLWSDQSYSSGREAAKKIRARRSR